MLAQHRQVLRPEINALLVAQWVTGLPIARRVEIDKSLLDEIDV